MSMIFPPSASCSARRPSAAWTCASSATSSSKATPSFRRRLALRPEAGQRRWQPAAGTLHLPRDRRRAHRRRPGGMERPDLDRGPDGGNKVRKVGVTPKVTDVQAPDCSSEGAAHPSTGPRPDISSTALFQSRPTRPCLSCAPPRRRPYRLLPRCHARACRRTTDQRQGPAEPGQPRQPQAAGSRPEGRAAGAGADAHAAEQPGRQREAPGRPQAPAQRCPAPDRRRPA